MCDNTHETCNAVHTCTFIAGLHAWLVCYIHVVATEHSKVTQCVIAECQDHSIWLTCTCSKGSKGLCVIVSVVSLLLKIMNDIMSITCIYRQQSHNDVCNK